MILQNPQLPEVYPEGYYISWDFPLWIAMTTLCFIGTFIFFRRCKKAEIIKENYT